VNVDFRVEADGTRVTLTHTGWQLAAVPCCALQGWSGAEWAAILEMHFAQFTSGHVLAIW
jgi:hypothetical protein